MLNVTVSEWGSHCGSTEVPQCCHIKKWWQRVRLLGGCEGGRFETPQFALLFSSQPDGRGPPRPAFVGESIRFLFPYQRTPCLFPFRHCHVSYTIHLPHVSWKTANAVWGLARTPRVPCQRSALIVSALEYSFSVYSFTDRSKLLPQGHKDVLKNVSTLAKWLPLYCRAFPSQEAALWNRVPTAFKEFTRTGLLGGPKLWWWEREKEGNVK